MRLYELILMYIIIPGLGCAVFCLWSVLSIARLIIQNPYTRTMLIFGLAGFLFWLFFA